MMQLPPWLKASKILTRVQDRPILTGALLRLEKKGRGATQTERLVMYATNAFVFLRAVVGRPGEGDVEGPIPLIALRHMEKGVQVQLDEASITAGITHYDRVIAEPSPLRSDNRFANLPQTRYEEFRLEKPKRSFRVGLNPTLLKELTDAMGVGQNHGVALEFDLDEAKVKDEEGEYTYLKQISVKPIADREVEGVIMPVRLER